MSTTLDLARGLALPLGAVTRVAVSLWTRIDVGASNDCWPWKGSKSEQGYGHVKIEGRTCIVPRVIFGIVNGFLPPVVMHSCDYPPCCNPAHLLPGTRQLNNADKMRKGRHRPSFGDSNGSRRHPERLARGDDHFFRRNPERVRRGEAHGRAKLNAESVAEIRRLFSLGGIRKIDLARRFDVGQSQIGRILRRECWT